MLASIIVGSGADGADLSTPKNVTDDPSICSSHTCMRHDALRQARLPIREGRDGVISGDAVKGEAYIGCQSLHGWW